MAVDIPNLEDAAHYAVAVPNATDFRIYEAAISGIGVISGCEVTADSPASMDLDVAEGVVEFAGVEVAVSAGSVTVTTAHASNPRRDLVVVSDAGVKSVVAGTPKALDPDDPSIVPVLPDLPADRVALRAVYVPAGATTLTEDKLNDRRVLLSTVTPFTFNQIWLGLPTVHNATGVVGGGTGTAPNAFVTAALSASADEYFLHNVVMPSNYAGGQLRVTVFFAPNGTSGGNVRWRINYSVLEAGDIGTETGTNVDFTQAHGTTTDAVTKTTAQTFTPSGLAAGDMLRLNVGRLGTDAAGTATNATRYLGMLIEYDV